MCGKLVVCGYVKLDLVTDNDARSRCNAYHLVTDDDTEARPVLNLRFWQPREVGKHEAFPSVDQRQAVACEAKLPGGVLRTGRYAVEGRRRFGWDG